MTKYERLGLSSRAFVIAAILGLSLLVGDARVLQATLMLAAIGGLAEAADFSKRIPSAPTLFAEAALSAIVLGLTLPAGAPLLPYLVVPALIAGVTFGIGAVVAVTAVQVTGLGLPLLAAGLETDWALTASALVPWVVTSFGVGAVSARLRSLFGRWDDTDAAYESARRLLGQLRTVTRRLSSGLDSVSLGNEILEAVEALTGSNQSALFVRTDAGLFVPLTYSGAHARETIHPNGLLVARAWDSLQVQSEPQPAGSAQRRHRTVVPVRVGARPIGVVVVESAAAPQDPVELAHAIEEHALRLDAGLVFDEIRSWATVQERHRLAREIHDGVAQEIASLGYAVDDLAAQANSPVVSRRLHELRLDLTRIVSDLRLSIFDLRTEVSAGLGSALSDYVREVGARSGMTVHTTLDEAPTRLRSDVETELFRIAQEAITNARKHSAAKNLWIDCTIRPPHARLSIRDDGKGRGVGRIDSFGMKVMQERAERIGASLDISQGRGQSPHPGTCVTVTVGEASQIRSRAIREPQ